MLNRSKRLAIFMQDAVLDPAGPGKMGYGVLRYSPNPIACVVDSQSAGGVVHEATGIARDCPIVATVEEAAALGAEVLILGIAPPGGLIPANWYPVIDKAVSLGLSIVNGLHDLLGPRYKDLKPGQWVWDIRIEPEGLFTGAGRAAYLPNKRLLMIGTDMAVGKMTAALEIHRAARDAGVRAEFIATGQIGITITGSGVPLDAVRVDFASGAIEREVMAVADAALIIVEGQGALCHPSSTATLPLLRGSCPTHLILCMRAGQTHVRSQPHIKIPPLGDYMRLYESLASTCGTFPDPRTVAVAINTAALTSEEADAVVKSHEDLLGLPCADPIRHGAERLFAAIR